MAVYTTLEWNDINTLIQACGIGDLVHCEGIAAGMENRNYFVTTSSHHLGSELEDRQGQYVLTLFEELPESQLPFHIKLLQQLQQEGIPIAAPINDYNGQALQHIKGLPAVLCPRLSGEHPQHPTIKQCQIIGSTLADIHNALQDFEAESEYSGIRDNAWLEKSLEKASEFLSPSENQLARDVFQHYSHAIDNNEFSQSIIHGDLFQDNSLFQGNDLIGIIDFFNAGRGFCLYDLAIVVNDWCLNKMGQVNHEHYHQLVSAYKQKRNFTAAEKRCWPVFLQICALRFWISRLLNQKQRLNEQHELTTHKDPLQYKRILLNHRSNPELYLP